MQRTSAIIVALGAFLAAAPSTLAQGLPPHGAYAPPPPAGFSPPYYGLPCYAATTRRERDKGIRHWTGWCRYQG